MRGAQSGHGRAWARWPTCTESSSAQQHTSLPPPPTGMYYLHDAACRQVGQSKDADQPTGTVLTTRADSGSRLVKPPGYVDLCCADSTPQGPTPIPCAGTLADTPMLQHACISDAFETECSKLKPSSRALCLTTPSTARQGQARPHHLQRHTALQQHNLRHPLFTPCQPRFTPNTKPNSTKHVQGCNLMCTLQASDSIKQQAGPMQRRVYLEAANTCQLVQPGATL